MKTKTLPGYWYCDALPNGDYVASQFNSDFNNYNEIYYLQHKLIYTVIGPNGFAGSGHDDNHAWEYNGVWNDRGPNAGLHAVSYDKDGNLVVIRESTGSNPTGALGYRYLDDSGIFIASVDTYSPASTLGKLYNIKELWEYTIRDNGNLIVGQGGYNVEAIIDGKYRVNVSKLINNEVQNARYVNFHRNGDNLSISWYYFRSPTDYVACFVWLTVQELRALITEPVPVPSTGEIMIKAFERPMWQAPFFSFSRQYGNDSLEEYKDRGNAIWITYDEAEDVLSYGFPMIVHATSPTFNKPQILNQTIAWWVSGGDSVGLKKTVIDVINNYPERPIIAYLDADTWPDPNPFNNNDRVWPSIQAYRFLSESLDQFKLRVDGVIKRVSKYNLPMFLTTRFDDFNGSSTITNIVECMPLYEKWMRDYYIIGHMPFSDRRGNGISKNEILQLHARAFLYAIPFERPNRFDYWRLVGSDVKAVLENKLGQSRASIVLESYLRTDILSKYGNTPPPPPPPPPGIWPNLLSLLQQVRSEHPSKIGVDECVIILNKVAWIAGNGWGLLKKTGGNHGAQPKTGIPCSVDWLINKNLILGADCLIDAPSSTEGPSLALAAPIWPNKGVLNYDPNNWTAPVEP